jgi:hypothetical protein
MERHKVSRAFLAYWLLLHNWRWSLGIGSLVDHGCSAARVVAIRRRFNDIYVRGLHFK